MHQHEIAVFDLSREHAELRLDVRARVIVRDNEFAVGRTGFLRERVVAPECKDKKIAVHTVNGAARARFFAERGVDFIYCDYGIEGVTTC